MVLATSVYSMDEVMEDVMHTLPSTYSDNSSREPTWTNLATTIIAQHEYTNNVRYDNLVQIIQHMRRIKWRIAKLPLHDSNSQQIIIGKIQEVINGAKDWRGKMNHLLALDPLSQKILVEGVDEFCHDRFDALQPQFKVLTDELDAKVYHPESLDFDALLNTMNGLTLK
jgi:hypothetical protein